MEVASATFKNRLLVETINVDLSCACFLQLRDTLFEGFVGPGSVLLAGQRLRIESLGVCLSHLIPIGAEVSTIISAERSITRC